MAVRSLPPRWSPGFSLDQAARIQRMIVARGAPLACPSCGTELRPLVGGAGAEQVWLVRCDRCARGMVVQVDTGEAAP
ncbi:MAG: hypothetical protein HY560_07695 [Gemmatimonadetes bacterium]|nr:hypothetical protein [Gemmatimonadota bacterium]